MTGHNWLCKDNIFLTMQLLRIKTNTCEFVCMSVYRPTLQTACHACRTHLHHSIAVHLSNILKNDDVFGLMALELSNFQGP